MKKRLLKDIFYPLLALGIFLSIWAIVAEVEQVPLVLPQVDVVFSSFFSLLGTKACWIAFSGTLKHVLLTFTISFFVALLLSIISTIKPVFHKVLSPINTILRAAPTIVVIYLMILWFHYDEVPIVIGFLIAYPLLYSFFRNTFVNVNKDQLEMANTFNVSKINQLRFVYIPNILPSIFDSCASVISLTVKVVIAAEILANVNDCIGFGIQIANSWIETPELLAYTILAIILSFILELIFLGLKKLAEVKYGY